MMIILPSIASANQADLAGELRRVGDHPYLHFDIEDGNFVSNITFGIKTIAALRPLSAADFDAHLMVTDPMAYIPRLLALRFRSIAFHWESTQYPMGIINAIRDGECRVGLAVNPRTAVSEILPYAPQVDYALVMTSEPDGHGDQFQPQMLDKIRRLHAAAPDLPIVADGGISQALLPAVQAAGARGAVMGRAIFSAPNPAAVIQACSNI